MANSQLFIILFIIMSTTQTSGLSKCRPLPGKPAALFIFGDSYFDSGNNNYINTTTLDQANFWPYGETYFKFPTGRFSDGRLISDFIAEYAKLPLIPPFLQPGVDQMEFYEKGLNFASAGAGALVETFQGSVINLKTQLSYYEKAEDGLRKKLGKVESKMTLSRAVYLFSIGTNDYISLFLTNSSTSILNSSHSQYVATVIGNLTTVIREIYKRGGRKFGFLILGPLGCFPGLRVLKPQSNGSTDSCLDEEASLLARLHNDALLKSLSRMGKRWPGFKYTLYDFYIDLKRRMNNPSKYGLKEGKTACCGTGRFRGTPSCGGRRPVKEFELCDDPNDHVFWDTFHLTENVYHQMANQMWSGGGGGSSRGSYSLKTLFQCL